MHTFVGMGHGIIIIIITMLKMMMMMMTREEDGGYEVCGWVEWARCENPRYKFNCTYIFHSTLNLPVPPA